MKPIIRISILTLLGMSGALGAEFEKAPFKASSGRDLRYALLRPAVERPGTAYPLVLSLHGAGGRGAKNWEERCGANRILTKPEVRRKYPCFVVAPTVKKNESWVGERQEDLFDLLDRLQNDLPIDGDRIYVTGQSMGGFGTFAAIMKRPEFFAAAVPVCGGSNPAHAEKIIKVPIWIFHGAKDKTVPVARSREMAEALKKAGGKPKYTEFPDAGHNSWTPAYHTEALWEWLFAQRRVKE